MAEKRLEDFSDLLDGWFWEVDETLAFTYLTRHAEDLLDIEIEGVIGKRRDQVATNSTDAEYWREHLADLHARRPFKDFVYPRLRNDGATIWIKVSGEPYFDEDGTFRGYRGVGVDVTSEREAASKITTQSRDLRLKEAMFLQVERLANIGGWELDLVTEQLNWSPEVFRIYETPPGFVPDLESALASYPEEVHSRLLRALERARKNGDRFDLVLPFVTMNGNRRWIRTIGEAELVDGAARRLFGTFQDVTETREREEDIRSLALTDSLTGLDNRTAFQKVLEKRVAEASARGGKVQLLLVDLDQFKEINDHFGHDMGDWVLKTAASHLTARKRDSDSVARLGGDEFAIITHERESDTEAHSVVDRLIPEFSFSVDYNGRVADTTLSVGVATYPDHADNPDDLMRNADLALYHSKRSGRLRSTVFQPRMREEFAEKMSVILAFKEALKQGQIVPYYQPIIDLRTGLVSGFESLLRWLDPERGVLVPGRFAPVFEDRELMATVGAHVATSVMGEMAGWSASGIPFNRVGINVTEADLCDGQYATRIERQLAEHDLEPNQLVIEITENTAFNSESGNILVQLETLHRLGTPVALDDFGTGSSSLNHLKMLPVSILKIDKSFVRGITDNVENLAIASAMISLGQTLGYSTVAEGIETVEEEGTLRRIGCERVQGFLYARPMPAGDVPRFLERHIGDLAARTRDRSFIDGSMANALN